MWDAVSGGLQPQPCDHNIIWAPPYAIPRFPKNWPPTPQVLKSIGAPICPSTAYEGAQTLYIHPIWMLDAVSGMVCSFDNDSKTHHNVHAFMLCYIPIFQFFGLTSMGIIVWGCTTVPIHSYKGAQTCFIHPIWMWDAVSGGLEPQQEHHNIICAPPFSPIFWHEPRSSL